MAITHKAHELIHDHFEKHSDIEKQVAIDATCGNGHDTKFLCDLGFESIYAFDIQEKAREQTKLTTQHYDNVTIIPYGHETMHEHINTKAQLVMFNLGYLPNSDKTITTLVHITMIALDQTIELLDKNGFLSVICYPGHEEGKIETSAVNKWFESKRNTYFIQKYPSDILNSEAPTLYTLIKF